MLLYVDTLILICNTLLNKVPPPALTKKGPFTTVAAFSAVTASEANYGVGVQVKIHPPPGGHSLGAPFTETERNSKTSRKKMQITKKFLRKFEK